MRASYLFMLLVTLLITPLAYADTPPTDTGSSPMSNAMSMNPAPGDDAEDAVAKPCMTIAKACLGAGFARRGAVGKRFWMDCMMPILVGKSVSGLSINPQDVSACKQAKINRLQNELNMLQSSQGGQQ